MPGHGHMKNQKLLILSLLVLLIPFSVFAAPPGCNTSLVPCGGTSQPACQFCDIFVLIDNVISFILTCLAPIVAILVLVIGGLYLLTAGSSPERVSKAKSIITSVVIGLVIIFVAWVFLNTFLDAIGVETWTGLKTWWKIDCGGSSSSSSSMVETNTNQQSAVAGQPQFFVGVNQPIVDEDIPLPPF